VGQTPVRSSTLTRTVARVGQSAFKHRDNMVAGELAAHGVTWLADIDLAPAWATGPSSLYITDSNGKPAVPRSTAANYGAYANYAAQVEAPYHPSGVEIWNEEDLWTFWYHPDPSAYGKLFDVAQRAVKRVNPGALVIAGGISQYSPHFLAQVINADPSFHPDGLAFHGYYQTPAEDLAHFEADADQADSLGLRVPIYADEYGWQTGRHVMPGGTWTVSAAQRRSYMAPMLKVSRKIRGSPRATGCNGRPAARGPDRPPTPPHTRPRSSSHPTPRRAPGAEPTFGATPRGAGYGAVRRTEMPSPSVTYAVRTQVPQDANRRSTPVGAQGKGRQRR
jgi:hypothetical protein